VVSENKAIEHKCIVVCGPTATGKTRIAVRIAAEHNGEIVSADSRQVYRTLDIGSGKDLCEYRIGGKTVPYHCIDIAEPETVFTLYQYLDEFNRSCNGIISRGALPVIAGGTGLYIEGALKEYDVPHAPEDVVLREELMTKEKDDLIDMLKKYPDIFARTDLSSKKRIVRSLEIAIGEEKGTTSGHEREKLAPMTKLVLGIFYDREILHARILARLESRLDSGMIEEVERLVSHVKPERIRMFGMEYSHVASYLWNEVSYDQMKENLYHSICRLAKRQMTWFRGMSKRGIPVIWVNGDDQPAIDEHVEKFLE